MDVCLLKKKKTKKQSEICVDAVWHCKQKEERQMWASFYLRSPPCPFSRASYGEPGLRSTGHWCRSPLGSSQSATEAAQVPGPLTTLYSRNSFTSAGTGRETFAHQVKTAAAKTNSVDDFDASLIRSLCRFIRHLQKERCERISNGPVCSGQHVKVKVSLFISLLLDNLKTAR